MSKKVDKDVKEGEEIFEEEENDEDKGHSRSHSTNYKNKIWIVDILDLYELIDSYIEKDDRFKWIGITDILYGPRSSYKIRYDEDINEFINEFLNELNEIFNRMKRKKLEIIEDDKLEFDKLISLNKQKIYSRIAFCLEKWYV